MNPIISDLYELMEERCSSDLIHSPEYRNSQQALTQYLDQLQPLIGVTERKMLLNRFYQGTKPELEAAFAWGLKLGLALDRL